MTYPLYISCTLSCELKYHINLMNLDQKFYYLSMSKVFWKQPSSEFEIRIRKFILPVLSFGLCYSCMILENKETYNHKGSWKKLLFTCYFSILLLNGKYKLIILITSYCYKLLIILYKICSFVSHAFT